MKRTTLALGGALIAAAVVTVALHWRRANERTQVATASLPAPPEFRGFPSELEARVRQCEADVRAGRNGTGPLGELARLYQANGFFPEAAKCARGLIALEPANPHWPYQLAAMSADAGRLEDALRLWQRAAILAPSYLPIQLRIGDALFKLDRRDEAAATYTRVLAAEADNPYALLGLARIDLAAGRWPEARQRLEAAAAHSGGAIGGDLLVSVYEHLGDTDQAAQLRGKAKSSGAYFEIPDPWAAELYAYCYDDHRLTIQSGLALQAGDTQRALQLLERALLVAPDSMQANFQLGLLERQLGDNARARQCFEACTRNAPEFSEGWVNLAEMLRTQGDPVAAERVLGEGLLHCPESPALHLLRAQRLAAAQEWDGAVAEYQKVIQLRPEEAGPFLALAKIYFTLGRTDRAVEYLRRSLASEPEFPPALATLALYSIETGDETGARNWMQHVREQVRIPREQRQALVGRYRERFGREPW
ncbi:MAG TPA: tetratricopeptide repeat protein [Candidatus Didemnitutus sp.]|nr:tetratricopeptide repeat protein [Candidatus Didemnitutus sp.]